MPLLTEVQVTPSDLRRFATVVRDEHMHEAVELAHALREAAAGRVVWNVNSTAAGGGVAEMLHRLVGYGQGAQIDARWMVISGTSPFFQITKRLHNALHGVEGDGSPLDESARVVYEEVSRANARELASYVRPGDVLILHDPQTAGMVPYMVDAGATVVWRCHVGCDHSSEQDDLGWAFLRPYLENVPCSVFTRTAYAPEYLKDRHVIIPPNIDPFSPKNQTLEDDVVRAILVVAGIVDGATGSAEPIFLRGDDAPRRVERRANVVRAGALPSTETPLVVQVSRWDRLKDPLGVMRGFARFAANGGSNGSELVLAGPESSAVADDPEGAEVFEEVLAAWHELPAELRSRVHIAALPMEDLEENAAIVNALQRHASIVVQKSIHEGFGLTVTEAMWKARPVVASAVGGINDQIEDRRSGVLVRDPTDLEQFQRALAWVLQDPARAASVGAAARERVRDEYLGLRSLIRFGRLLLDRIAAS